MGERFYYWGDVYCDQNALDLLQDVVGKLPEMGDADFGAFVVEQIEMGCVHIDICWDPVWFSGLEAWALACLDRGYFVEGRWVEFSCVDAPLMQEFVVGDLGVAERSFTYLQLEPVEWRPADYPCYGAHPEWAPQEGYNDTHSYERNAHTCVGGEGE